MARRFSYIIRGSESVSTRRRKSNRFTGRRLIFNRKGHKFSTRIKRPRLDPTIKDVSDPNKKDLMELPQSALQNINRFLLSPRLPKLSKRIYKTLGPSGYQQGIPSKIHGDYYTKILKIRPGMSNQEFIDTYYINGIFKHPNLIKFNCNETQIEELPDLPNLTHLICSNTPIRLPDLPKLKYLICSNTQIIKLPYSPNLIILCCSRTPIIEIPDLPKLKYLDCSNTQIRKLPNLPNLTILSCRNTQIRELPELPKLRDLCCAHSGIHMLQLQQLPRLKLVIINEGQFDELQINNIRNSRIAILL